LLQFIFHSPFSLGSPHAAHTQQATWGKHGTWSERVPH
jgi:hypothetical protein